MKVKIFCIYAFLLSVTSLLAAADDGVKFQLPAIQNFAVEDKVQVSPTGSVQRISAGTPEAETGNDTAAEITESGVEWLWKPSPLTSYATGGADLTDAAISPDGSVVVLVERVGGEGSPNSARLVFVSLKRGKIVRIADVPERRITAVRWFDRNHLILLQSPQPELESPGLFALFSLAEMKISAESCRIDGVVSSWTYGNGRVFYTLAGENSFYFLPLGRMKDQPRRIEIGRAASKVLWLKRTRELAVYGDNGSGYYRPDQQGGYFLEKSIDFPAGFIPVSAVEAGRNGDMALISGNSEAALVTGGVFRKLARNTGGLLCYSPASSTLFIEQQRFNGFLPCRMPDGRCGKAMVPGKLKPMNRNRNFRIFALNEKHPAVILVDHRANIYRIDIKSKRPVKHLVMEVDRTGFR